MRMYRVFICYAVCLSSLCYARPLQNARHNMHKPRGRQYHERLLEIPMSSLPPSPTICSADRQPHQFTDIVRNGRLCVTSVYRLPKHPAPENIPQEKHG